MTGVSLPETIGFASLFSHAGSESSEGRDKVVGEARIHNSSIPILLTRPALISLRTFLASLESCS
jgi:hypothetical protein